MESVKFSLPEAIIFGGFAFFADILSIIPFVGSFFLMLFWGIFKFKGLSAPIPFGSMFIKVIPLVSFIAPGCTLYIWRVYQRNQPGNILSAIPDAVPNPAATVASLHLVSAITQEGTGDKLQQEKKAA